MRTEVNTLDFYLIFSSNQLFKGDEEAPSLSTDDDICGEGTWQMEESIDFEGGSFQEEQEIGQLMRPVKRARYSGSCFPARLYGRFE